MKNSAIKGEGLRLSSPADVVAAIPYLVGFHPANSLVVLGSGGPHGTFVIRLDLPPDRPDLSSEDQVLPSEGVAELLSSIGDLIVRRDTPDVILVGYGPGERVTPAIEAAWDRMAERGLRLHDALRVEDGRFWSYLCADATCCPPEGTPFDVSTSVIAAQATACGLVALADRSELERVVRASGDEAVRHATERAEEQLMDWAEQAPAAVRERMVTDGLPLVRTLIARAVDGDGPPSDDDVAWLGVLLTHLRVRDEAWVRIEDDHLPIQVAFWSDIVRRVEDPYVAGPACLLAFAAWRSGDGALANVALDRALAVSPGYSMAHLLRELITSGVAPWAAPLPMSAEQLAKEWEDHRG